MTRAIARSRKARTALREIDASAADIGSLPTVVDRGRCSYPGRLERLEQLRATRASSPVVRAELAHANESTRELFDALNALERNELQRIQNEAIIDGETARRLSMELDLRRR